MSEPQTKKTKVSALDQLKAMTTIVADTGDFEGMSNIQKTPKKSVESVRLHRYAVYRADIGR